MNPSVRFCLVLHNHQPVGNFDGVFEQAYQDSYLPFLDVFEPYEHLNISLHTSGPLMKWLAENHAEYIDRLSALVAAGRVEILGGAFYEPILTMIPSRDRIGQITRYSQWLKEKLGAEINGMWIPERVWEQNLTADLASSDIQYTILDDYHFKNAGLTEEQLNGFYVTEEEGRLLRVFPGSEQLRYLIPFRPPGETIEHLREIAENYSGAVAVFGDDGEKFGTWPDTKKHVYDEGWLRNFFDLLTENRNWLHTTTLQESVTNTRPVGKIYLPDGSYREMTEWALPVPQQLAYDEVTHQMHDHEQWSEMQKFIRGGFWRNFKVKYPEADEMYSRMMYVSSLLQQAEQEGQASPVIDSVRDHLYQGQCNCSFWHGAFGGIYLPHLRNAVYEHLIAAENLLDQATRNEQHWVEATADDYNFDARQEIRLASDKMIAWISPSLGGQMYELDVRSICHNLLATIARREEAYHGKILQGEKDSDDECASIHDRVVFKQKDLDKRLQYDNEMRNSLIDHFWDNDVTLDSVSRGDAMERGDFATGSFKTKLRRNSDRTQVHLSRQGNAWGVPLSVTKGVTLNSNSNTLEIAYLVEGLSQTEYMHLGVELNFSGLPSGADDRYFYQGDHDQLGQLGTKLDLHEVTQLNMVDQWLGIDVGLDINRPTSIWTYPVETVSQSEGGFELVHQSVVVQPHWWIKGDAEGRWTTTIQLSLDTSLAECRQQESQGEVIV